MGAVPVGPVESAELFCNRGLAGGVDGAAELSFRETYSHIGSAGCSPAAAYGLGKQVNSTPECVRQSCLRIAADVHSYIFVVLFQPGCEISVLVIIDAGIHILGASCNYEAGHKSRCKYSSVHICHK